MVDPNNFHIDDLREHVSLFPRMPGVYLMRDEVGEVIYVGKARDLRARVRQYFGTGDGRQQIVFLMKRVRTIERIVTENENQAFVLERDLITRYKPRYNIKLKDDKSYLCVRIDTQQEWPRVELVRKVKEDGARYFGPYSFNTELRSLLETIKRTVPLRTCADTVFHNRVRPCLEYQIKRCAGPCCLEVERQQYKTWVREAMAILEGRTEKLQKELEAQMEKASEELRFEDAATLRDRLAGLRGAKEGQALYSSKGEHKDVFSLYREERLVVLCVLNVRYGRIADSKQYELEEVSVSDEEVLESALTQYYQSGREVPEEIVLPCELGNAAMVEGALREIAGHMVHLTAPERGLKARLLQLAETNAQQHFIATYDAGQRYSELAKRMQQRFALRQPPRRIECIDISNFQGTEIVGAVVHFADGEPDKARYRKYKISQQGKPDDFASIHEVVLRRLKRGTIEGDLPDLFIIDGGAQQLQRALAAREESNADVEMISLAKIRAEDEVRLFSTLEKDKKPERVFLSPSEEPLPLADGDELTLLLQRIRDEVHRFVITFHRSRREKRSMRSVLDQIPGLKPSMKQRLLREFGNPDSIRTQTAERVAQVGHMPLPLAQKILSFLSKNAAKE